jgi:hypothetical protein
VESALNTIDGYEAMYVICKGQVRPLAKGDLLGPRAFIHSSFGITRKNAKPTQESFNGHSYLHRSRSYGRLGSGIEYGMPVIAGEMLISFKRVEDDRTERCPARKR